MLQSKRLKIWSHRFKEFKILKTKPRTWNLIKHRSILKFQEIIVSTRQLKHKLHYFLPSCTSFSECFEDFLHEHQSLKWISIQLETRRNEACNDLWCSLETHQCLKQKWFCHKNIDKYDYNTILFIAIMFYSSDS